MTHVSSDNCVFVTQESMRADRHVPRNSGHHRLAQTLTWAFRSQSQKTKCSDIQGREEKACAKGPDRNFAFIFRLRDAIFRMIHHYLQLFLLPSWVEILRLEAVILVKKMAQDHCCTYSSYRSYFNYKITTQITSQSIGQRIHSTVTTILGFFFIFVYLGIILLLLHTLQYKLLDS